MTHDKPQEDDRRAALRYSINMPLTVLQGDREVSAYTRDVSNRGVYFFVEPEHEDLIRGEFQFLMDLPPEVTLSTYCRVRCRGIVVRKERTLNGPVGIAAKIVESFEFEVSSSMV